MLDAAARGGRGLRLGHRARRTSTASDARRADARTDRASARSRDELDLPTIYRVRSSRSRVRDADDQPVPPIDAWRLLQRTACREAAESCGASASTTC